MRKREIIKGLNNTKKRVDGIIERFDNLSSDDQTVKRHARNDIAYTTFELIDEIVKIEVGIYNYLRRGK